MQGYIPDNKRAELFALASLAYRGLSLATVYSEVNSENTG